MTDRLPLSPGAACLLALLALAPATSASFELRSKDGKDSLVLGARLQLLETVSADADDNVQSALSIPRARFSWKGKLGDELRYDLQTDFSDGDVELKDLRFTWSLMDGLWLDLGQ